MLPVLIGCALLGLFWTPDFTTQVVLMSIGVATIGLGHGAMDHRVGEILMRPRFGQQWPIIFALFYLTLGAMGLAFWFIAPAAALTAFLVYSAIHFGSDRLQENGILHAFMRGSIPILLPIALRPEDVSELFSTIAATTIWVEEYVQSVGILAAIAVLFTLISALRRREYLLGTEALVLVALNFTLPPLIAFSLYFVFLHSIRHIIELAGWIEPNSLAKGFSRIARESVPLTVITLLAGAFAINFARVGGIEAGVIQAVFVGLSCLTVPHMMITHLAEKRSADAEFSMS